MGIPQAAARPPRRRSDAGQTRLTERDISGLLLVAEQYAAPYDLLAEALAVTPAGVRAVTARWRAAGYAVTGVLGPGPAILGEVPYAGDLIPTLPPALKARLFAVTDLAIVWNKTGNQATVTAVIIDATLAALPEILNPGQPGYHDTTAPAEPQTVGVLAQLPITTPTAHPRTLLVDNSKRREGPVTGRPPSGN